MRTRVLAWMAACATSCSPAGADLKDVFVEVALVPSVINRDLDVLFVLDDSNSTLHLQQSLRAAFPQLLNVLNAAPGGFPNVHIGVVTSDLGTRGADDASPGAAIGSGPGSCAGVGKDGALQTNGATALSGSFISDVMNVDGTRMRNYTGSLADVFAQISSVGSAGCGFEQPLEAARRAVDNHPENVGFVRPTAGLAVIVLADEDDCSFAHSTLLGPDVATLGALQSFRCTRFGVTCEDGGATSDAMNDVGAKTRCRANDASPYLTPVSRYTDALAGLKVAPHQVYVATITGPASPVEVELRTPPGGGTAVPALAHSCRWTDSTGQSFVADPAVRLADAARQFARHSIGNACTSDYASVLTEIGGHMNAMIGSPCVTRPIPEPMSCTAFDVRGSAETLLAACGEAAAGDCWQLVSDATTCPAPPQLRVDVRRAAPAPTDTLVAVRCKQ